MPVEEEARIDTFEHAVETIAAGRMVVIAGEDPDAGALMIAATAATPQALNALVRRAGGWTCVALAAERCQELGLEPTGPEQGPASPRYTATVDAADLAGPAVSIFDRAHTLRTLADPESSATDLRSPGAVQPLMASAGGVLERAGITEAAVELAELAGLPAAAVICGVQNEDGSAATQGDLLAFARQNRLQLVRVAELVDHRKRSARLVDRVVAVDLPTTFGEFEIVGYQSLLDGAHHVALVKGEVAGRDDVLIRVHRECVAGTVFRSERCDCSQLLDASLDRIEQEGRGALIYLTEEGRDSFGFLDGLRDHFGDRTPQRSSDEAGNQLDAAIAAQVIGDLGPDSVRLLGGDSGLAEALISCGLKVTGRLSIGGCQTARRPAVSDPEGS